MSKFQCKYRITVTYNNEIIFVEYPLTLNFDVNRNTFSNSNTASFQIYNLAPETRNYIFQDRYKIYDYKVIEYEAGYGDNLTLIFKGKIQQAYSYRQGVDIITNIQALDIDIQAYAYKNIVSGLSSHTFATGTNFKDAYLTMASDMPNIKVGALGSLDGTFKTPTVFDETSFYAINKLTGNHTFIDNGVLHTLMDNEALGDYGVYVIESSTGLLGTPMRRDTQLEVSMVFEPNIVVGQLVEINSTTDSNFNGQFKVIGINHSGTISGAEAGQRITKLNLMVGALLPNANNALTGQTETQLFSMVTGQEIKVVNSKAPAAVQDVINYIQKYGKAPHSQVTKNIWWDELVKPNSLAYEKPTLQVLSNLYSVSVQLQNFLNRFYPGNRVTITSGWRSRGYNSTIKNAAPNSEHIYGNAIDFFIPGQINTYVFRNIQTYWGGRKKQYPSFIHIDRSRSHGKYANDF